MTTVQDESHPVAEQRVGIYTALIGLLQESGVDALSVLAQEGLSPRLLADPDGRIPFATAGRLLAASARATGRDHFGLLLGQRASLSYLGILAQVASNSPTLGAALRNFTVHHHLYSDGGVVYLFEDDGVVSFGYAIYHPGIEGAEQIYDAAVGQILGGISELIGMPLRPREILLSRRAPTDPAPYRRVLPVMPTFDAGRTEVRFDAGLMSMEVPGAEPARLRALTALLETAGRHNLTNRLRRTLRIQLLHGDTAGDHAAQMLDLHRRTLNRRLRRCGTTFQDVLDRVRFDTARHLLHLTNMPLPQIAASLGYVNVSSFTRAFGRWSGDTPARFRARAKAVDSAGQASGRTTTPGPV
jgi:AraC-like DNA-binding protein